MCCWPQYVFFSWQPNPEVTGIHNPVYTCLVGLLMPQWTLLGYDGSAHIAEEVHYAVSGGRSGGAACCGSFWGCGRRLLSGHVYHAGIRACNHACMHARARQPTMRGAGHQMGRMGLDV